MTDVEPEYEHVATFPGYVAGWTGDTTTNNLMLKVAVNGSDNKRAALPLTDIPGTMLRVTVEKIVPRKPEDDGA